jgi:acetyl-CoA hydrolase
MQTANAESLDLASLIRPAETVVCGQACAEPLTLMETLVAQRASLNGTRVFVGASFARTFQPEHTDCLKFTSFGALGTNRALAKAGALAIVPCHVAQLGPYFTNGTLPCDVLFVQLAPASTNGRYSFGATADCLAAAAARARLVVAEINDQAPRTFGEAGLTEADIDIAIHTSRPLPQLTAAAAGHTEQQMAAHAAAYINDRAVLQLGIGAAPDAILRLLTDRRDLAVHSGMIGDMIVLLIECGAITNAHKPIDTGITVTGALIGTDKLYKWSHNNPKLAVRAATHTHAEHVLAQFPTLVTINTAVQVDLTGQVNAEQIGDDYLGGIGGQADFVRAGHRAPNGHAIIALPATAKARSRIVPCLTTGVTTPRCDVDVVVTEFGAAELRGATLAERAKRIIAIAHPDFREALERDAHAIAKRGF